MELGTQPSLLLLLLLLAPLGLLTRGAGCCEEFVEGACDSALETLGVDDATVVIIELHGDFDCLLFVLRPFLVGNTGTGWAASYSEIFCIQPDGAFFSGTHVGDWPPMLTEYSGQLYFFLRPKITGLWVEEGNGNRADAVVSKLVEEAGERREAGNCVVIAIAEGDDVVVDTFAGAIDVVKEVVSDDVAVGVQG